MAKRVRRWDVHAEEDPLAGLVNLFDLWMVFSIALLLALVGASKLPEFSAASANDLSSEMPSNEERSKLDRFRMSQEKLTGEGQRLGTAYRLKNGEVVYVPD